MSVLGCAVDVVGLRAAVDSEDIPCRLFGVGDSNVNLEIGAANAAIRTISALSELLREDGGRLSVGLEEDWEDIADQVGLDCDATRGVVSCLAHYGALVVEDGTLFSPLVSSGIAAREDISEKRRAAAQARWERMNAARKEKKEG